MFDSFHMRNTYSINCRIKLLNCLARDATCLDLTCPAVPCSPAELRRLRLQKNKGIITEEEYAVGINGHIGFAIGMQEALGLDVFVHGESERTDMVSTASSAD